MNFNDVGKPLMPQKALEIVLEIKHGNTHFVPQFHAWLTTNFVL